MKWCAVLTNGSLEKLYNKDPYLNCDFWIERISTERKGKEYHSLNTYSIDEYVIHSGNFHIRNMTMNDWTIKVIRDPNSYSGNSLRVLADVSDPSGITESISEFDSDFLGVSKIVKKFVSLSKYSSWAVSRQAENAEKVIID